MNRSVETLRIPKTLRRATTCAAVLLAGCGAPSPSRVRVPGAAAATQPRTPVRRARCRELRGVWVATVGNLDWPSAPGLSAARQRQELVALLDTLAALNANAVILQVRPAADALYPSALEPWSEVLSGTQGVPPEPLWDPLAFAIERAHARGLELHAWFNPYRARTATPISPAAADHVSRRRPDLVKVYGKQIWMDPGEEDVATHSLAAILDVVKRYDVDGIHLDDYFYPYPEKDAAGNLVEFPDDPSFAKYVASGGALGREDWRRWNVNTFVKRLHGEVKALKEKVRVGISPFGIWRPGRPAQVKGFDAYEEISADARTWLQRGWVDYLAPQLYWPIGQKEQSFPALLAWWAGQNPKGRFLWPGLAAFRVGEDGKGWAAAEIAEQIRRIRAQPGVAGHILFSARALIENRGGIATELRKDVWAEPVETPER
ncbi:MAG TPA: family 10 glycosylhydrolase [Thermoanaerobaculia bacterium]|nr:family 10 glycosylhydrolase [Thermoanaerobaculia bacterium]